MQCRESHPRHDVPHRSAPCWHCKYMSNLQVKKILVWTTESVCHRLDKKESFQCKTDDVIKLIHKIFNSSNCIHYRGQFQKKVSDLAWTWAKSGT